MGTLSSRRGRATLVAFVFAAMPLLALGSPGRVSAVVDTPPPPHATDDNYATAKNTKLTIAAPGLLANDNALPTSCAYEADPPSNGTIAVMTDGSFEYTPNTGYVGLESFTYGLQADGCTGVPDSFATVDIDVTDSAPVAKADSFTALVGRTLSVKAPGVLGNDSDPDGDPLTAELVNDVSHGDLVLAANGSFSYTPTAGYLGPDAFSYRASDGTKKSPARIVTLSVAAVPTPSPSPAPTPSPTPAVTAEPSPTESAAPSESPSAAPSSSPSASPSAAPSATAAPATNPDSSGGVPLLPIIVGLLLISGIAFGAGVGIPMWRRYQAEQSGGRPFDDQGP